MQLEFQAVKKFEGFRLEADFSLSSARTGIFGPSGCGKSTIMNLLSGLYTPDNGRITLDEKVLFDSEQRVNLKPEQRGIGIVFQHAHLFPHMSVKKNLLYGYKRTKPEKRRVEPEKLFDVLDITRLMDRGVTTLSGGERQRIALARTVLACPDLIMMDEPLSALDEDHKFQIIPYLNTVFAEFGIPLLFISHSMLEMRMMTDEVLVMQKGRILHQASAEDLAKQALNGGTEGYVNLVRLDGALARCEGGLCRYPWGNTKLVLKERGESGTENLFELDAREILLFKNHPAATSARNLLAGIVSDIWAEGDFVRVAFSCGQETMIAEILPESLQDLGIEKGSPVVAAFKAAAFKKLF